MPDTNPENYAVINIINGWIDLCGATKESLATFFKRSSCLEKIVLCFCFIVLFILLVFLISIIGYLFTSHQTFLLIANFFKKSLFIFCLLLIILSLALWYRQKREFPKNEAYYKKYTDITREYLSKNTYRLDLLIYNLSYFVTKTGTAKSVQISQWREFFTLFINSLGIGSILAAWLGSLSDYSSLYPLVPYIIFFVFAFLIVGYYFLPKRIISWRFDRKSYRLTAAKELLDLCMIIQLQDRSLDRNGSHFIDFQ